MRDRRYSRGGEERAKKRTLFGLEAGFGTLMVLAGVAIAAVSVDYGFGSIARPGPGLYPFFVGAMIAAFALWSLISTLRHVPAEATLDRAGAAQLVLIVAVFCFWIVAMPLLGYVVVTLLSTYALRKFMRLEGWRPPLALSTGTALFLYLLFERWLYIDLPRGILG